MNISCVCINYHLFSERLKSTQRKKIEELGLPKSLEQEIFKRVQRTNCDGVNM